MIHPSFRLLIVFAVALCTLQVPCAYAAEANITIMSEDADRSFPTSIIGNTSPTNSSLPWQQIGNIRFILGHIEEVPNEQAQSYYDTRSNILQFLKTFDAKQINSLKENKSLKVGDMSENQRKILVDLLRKQDSYVPGLGEQKLSDFLETAAGQKDVSVLLIFNLGSSFISNRLSPRVVGGPLVNLPSLSLGSKPFVPFIDEEEFGKLQKTLDEAAKGASESEDASVIQNLKDKTVQLSKIAHFEPGRPMKQPLVKWLSDISAVTGVSLSVERELGNHSISVTVDADASVSLSDLLKAMSLTASDATEWRSIQSNYYLSEKSKRKVYLQRLAVKFRELDSSMTNYVYRNYSQELRQARLPEGLFLMPKRTLNAWPETSQNLIGGIARRVLDKENNKQNLEIILDPNNRDQILVSLSIVPTLLILYKEGWAPGETGENSALLTTVLSGFSPDLSQ